MNKTCIYINISFNRNNSFLNILTSELHSLELYKNIRYIRFYLYDIWELLYSIQFCRSFEQPTIKSKSMNVFDKGAMIKLNWAGSGILEVINN